MGTITGTLTIELARNIEQAMNTEQAKKTRIFIHALKADKIT